MNEELMSRVSTLRTEGKNTEEIARRLRISKGKVLAMYRNIAIRNGTFNKPSREEAAGPDARKGPLPGAVSAVDFVKPFDIPQKVLDVLADFGDNVIEDDNLRRNMKASIERWRAVRGMPKLAKFQLIIPGNRRIWGRPETLERVRDTIYLTNAVQ